MGGRCLKRQPGGVLANQLYENITFSQCSDLFILSVSLVNTPFMPNFKMPV